MEKDIRYTNVFTYKLRLALTSITNDKLDNVRKEGQKNNKNDRKVENRSYDDKTM